MLLGTPPAWAQVTDGADDALPGEDAVERAEEGEAASAESRRSTFATGPTITYREILENPQDIELNFRYARQQVERGDLKGAAATLERILLIEPDRPRVRLFHAIVLFRLDNIEEAERELKVLRQRYEMERKLEDEIDAYLEEIAQRRKRTRFSFLAGIGTHYDTNRNAGPSSDEVLFLGLPLDLAPGDRREDDFGFIGFGQLSVRHDTGSQARHEVIGEITYLQDEQVTEDQLDLQSLSAEGGLRLRFPFATVEPTVFASGAQLSRESYYRAAGANLKVTRRLSADTEAVANARYTAESFDGIAESRNADQRTGARYEGRLGLNHAVLPWLRAGAHYGFTRKTARVDHETYDRHEVEVRATALLGVGQFVSARATAGRNDYDDNDPIVSPRTREDDTLRLRLTYGTPINLFLPGEGLAGARDVLEGFNLNLGAEYYRRDSNLRNFDYENVRGDAMITKRWDF